MHPTIVSTREADKTSSLSPDGVGHLRMPEDAVWRLAGKDGKAPIVWHDKYDFPLPLELAQPRHLNPQKRAQIGLKAQAILGDSVNLSEAPRIDRDPVDLYDGIRAVHGREYLHGLTNDSKKIAHAMQIPVGEINKYPFESRQQTFVEPALYATSGTILAARLALDHGWSINTSGGFHHAGRNKAEGFCLFADIPIALAALRIRSNNLRALIIDLDAHHGNGTLEILGKDPLVTIFDVFNKNAYPCNSMAELPQGEFLYPVSGTISDRDYLGILEANLSRAIESAAPNIIFFNAGYDVWLGDPLAQMSLSADAILQRDRLVFSEAKRVGVPIAMVVSGGYHPDVSSVVANTIKMVKEEFVTV